MFKNKEDKSKEENKPEQDEFSSTTGPGQSQVGSEVGYSVEARYNYIHPKEFNNQIFDNRWKQVQFYKNQLGVPTGGILNQYSAIFGLFSYQAAQALRWWFHAALNADINTGDMCWETRIVKHEIDYNVSEKPVSAHDYLGSQGGEDSRKPREGVK